MGNLLGTNLKILLDQRKISQRELSRTLACSHISVNEWVRGIKEPRTEMRKKIANFFGVEEFQLFQEPAVPASMIYTYDRNYGKLSDSSVAQEDNTPENNLTRFRLRPLPIYTIKSKFVSDILDEGNHPGISEEYMNFYSTDPYSFFVRVFGEEYIGSGLLENDLVLVEPLKKILADCLCLCKYKKAISINRYTKQEDTILLLPINNKSEPIVVKNEKDLTCYKITNLVRKF